MLEVAPSGYYDWLKRPVSKRAPEDARLLRLIRASFVASQGIYGAPRVFLDLREAGETCSKHRVTRLMRLNGLRALHGYRPRRGSVGKPSVLIPNVLQRQFTVTRRNKAWVTDIPYIRTWQGWLYLAVVMDLFSRQVIGWSAGPTIRRELVLNAVLMAVHRRRPRGTIIHSDQGTQGGFKRSLQHLVKGGVVWDEHETGLPNGQGVRRCARQAVRVLINVRPSKRSGRALRQGFQVRKRHWPVACRSRSVRAGSARLEGSRRSVWSHSPGDTCRLPSVRNSCY